MHYCNTKNRIKLSLAPRKLQDRRYLKQHMYCVIQMFWLAVMSLFFLHLGSLIAHMKDDEWPLLSRLVNAVKETFGLGNTRCLHMRVKVRPRHRVPIPVFLHYCATHTARGLQCSHCLVAAEANLVWRLKSYFWQAVWP